MATPSTNSGDNDPRVAQARAYFSEASLNVFAVNVNGQPGEVRGSLHIAAPGPQAPAEPITTPLIASRFQASALLTDVPCDQTRYDRMPALGINSEVRCSWSPRPAGIVVQQQEDSLHVPAIVLRLPPVVGSFAVDPETRSIACRAFSSRHVLYWRVPRGQTRPSRENGWVAFLTDDMGSRAAGQPTRLLGGGSEVWPLVSELAALGTAGTLMWEMLLVWATTSVNANQLSEFLFGGYRAWQDVVGFSIRAPFRYSPDDATRRKPVWVVGKTLGGEETAGEIDVDYIGDPTEETGDALPFSVYSRRFEEDIETAQNNPDVQGLVRLVDPRDLPVHAYGFAFIPVRGYRPVGGEEQEIGLAPMTTSPPATGEYEEVYRVFMVVRVAPDPLLQSNGIPSDAPISPAVAPDEWQSVRYFVFVDVTDSPWTPESAPIIATATRVVLFEDDSVHAQRSDTANDEDAMLLQIPASTMARCTRAVKRPVLVELFTRQNNVQTSANYFYGVCTYRTSQWNSLAYR